MSAATLREASDKALVDELRRRAKEENNTYAAKILRPSKKEAARGPR